MLLRDYKYSLKNNLKFRELESKDEVRQFYDVLQLNLNKLGLRSVHSYEDLVQLKFERFSKEIIFYGVYLGDKLIAGSMIFIFFEEIFHTQYRFGKRNEKIYVWNMYRKSGKRTEHGSCKI